MSHTTTLKGLVIRDVDAIKSAVAELKSKGIKIDLVENARPRMYYATQHGQCAYVLKLDGPYDVGLDRKADGTFTPVFDTWLGYVSSVLGVPTQDLRTPEEQGLAVIGKFSQSYAKFAAINQAVMMGYAVDDVSTDENGNVHLTIAVA